MEKILSTKFRINRKRRFLLDLKSSKRMRKYETKKSRKISLNGMVNDKGEHLLNYG